MARKQNKIINNITRQHLNDLFIYVCIYFEENINFSIFTMLSDMNVCGMFMCVPSLLLTGNRKVAGKDSSN